MTVDVKNTLDKICNNEIFNDELYFTGGTALAFYLNHRVSEDIDIVSSKTLPYKKIIPAITSLGAKKLQDENVTALRMAGLFPDEYMIKFKKARSEYYTVLTILPIILFPRDSLVWFALK